MAVVKDYVLWAAYKLTEDYPKIPFDVALKIVTNTNICEDLERYSMETYDKETIGGIK